MSLILVCRAAERSAICSEAQQGLLAHIASVYKEDFKT